MACILESAIMCPPVGGKDAALRDGRLPHSSLYLFILKVLWNKGKVSSLCIEECIFSLILLVFLYSLYFSMSGGFAFLSKMYLPILCSCPQCPWKCRQVRCKDCMILL